MIIKTIKINKLILFIFSLTIFIILVFVFIFNLPKQNTDLKKLNKICNDIESCNYNLKDGLNNNTIDTEKAKKTITNTTDSLNSLLGNLNTLELTSDKYLDLKNSLKSTLESNIKLLEFSNTLINNNSYTQTDECYNAFNDILISVQDGYKNVETLGLDIIFPENATNFFNSVYDYANTLIKLSRDSDITFEQSRNFELNIKSTISKLKEISEDLEPVIINIHENNRSLDSLIKDVKLKKSKLTTIKYETYNFSIPSGFETYYSKLQEVLNCYDIYINSFNSALETQNLSDKKFDTSDIYSNYKDSFAKYTTYKNTLSELELLLENQK